MVVTSFKALRRYFHGETEENVVGIAGCPVVVLSVYFLAVEAVG
jgi:hypothetical protein